MAVRESISQAWPPFVLVAGLLLIGVVAHRDGAFARAGEMLERLPGPPALLFVAAAALVAVVTAVLNLDTAVVFLTPVLILTARRRGLDEEPFLYAAVFLANASSLFLPGSNLTNLLVLAGHPISGGRFAAQLLAPALAAVLVTTAGLLLLFRTRVGRAGPTPPDAGEGRWKGPGVIAAAVAAVLIVTVRSPALPVLVAGLLAAGSATARRGLPVRDVVRAVSPHVLLALYAVSVALGVLARSWDGPAHLLASAGRLETAAVGAIGALLVNNLPAAVMLSARHVPHPRSLLIGLNLGPNLAVTGSLSAYLWIKAARQVGAQPSIRAFSRRGVLVAPPAILVALLVGSH